MYLLDTVVLSELRKPPRQRNRNLIHWIGEVPSQDLFVSVLTIGDGPTGIRQEYVRIPRRRPSVGSQRDRAGRLSFEPVGYPFFRCRFRNRTPGPPPFSSMNSTPANSKARRMTSSVARRG
jgi:hypothetical protein